jgi:hypothetical protein
MADIRPDRLATCQSERKSVVLLFFFVGGVRLLVLWPLLASCTSPKLYVMVIAEKLVE